MNKYKIHGSHVGHTDSVKCFPRMKAILKILVFALHGENKLLKQRRLDFSSVSIVHPVLLADSKLTFLFHGQIFDRVNILNLIALSLTFNLVLVP